METLKNVSDPTAGAPTQDKYKVVAPETMYETFMSDSEEEGGKFWTKKRKEKKEERKIKICERLGCIVALLHTTSRCCSARDID